MQIHPVYLLVIIIGFISYKVYETMNTNNQYHLKYLLFHFLSLLAIVTNYSLFNAFKIMVPIAVISMARSLSILFLFVHFKSIFIQLKAKIRAIDYILLSVLAIVNGLNSLGIKYIKYTFDSVSSNDIFYLGANYFIGKEDVLLVMIIIFLYYSFMIIGTIYRIRKNAALLEKTKKTVLKFSLLYWSLFFSATILVSLNFVLMLFKIAPFIPLSKAISLCSFLILILIPFLLKEIASIKAKTAIEGKEDNYFDTIEQFFKNSKKHLDPKYGLANLSLDLETRSDLIRNSIKECTQMSVPLFINSYRVKHVCAMIDKGYLTKYSMDALAEQCGFRSQPTFNRIFKSIKNQTPSEYAEGVKVS